ATAGATRDSGCVHRRYGSAVLGGRRMRGWYVPRVALVEHLVLLAHLLGFAALLGGALVQVRREHPDVNEAMLYGAITQLVTGIALVLLVIVLPPDGDLNTVKVTVKGLITLVITILVVANRR